MPVPASFASLLQDYLQNIRTAQAQNQHHDYRRALFLDFLRKAFAIPAEEVDVERFLKIDIGKKGWIDALFRNVVFEFKRNLAVERQDGLRELRDYLRTLPYGAECVGLLTEGLAFEVYVLDEGTRDLRQTDAFDLGKAEAEDAFLWLDAYLFSQNNVPPTSADLVRRFGLHSPTFQAADRILRGQLQRLAPTPALDVKRRQWRAVLAKVYGSDIGSDDLFVRHTFLNQFAKLLAYAALTDSRPQDDETLADIITGEAFHRFGVSNLGEIDFFAWILADEVRGETLAMLRRLAHSLVVYDLRLINEDLLKQLYQNLVDPETRHDLGEYYTPDWLAELTLDTIHYRPGQSLLDPSCGSGTFLFTAIRRLAKEGLAGWALVDFALGNVAGMDVHPLAVTTARINYLLAIIPHMRGERPGGEMGLAALPVYMADALLTPEESGPHRATVFVPVDRERDEYFFIPDDAAQAPHVFTDVIDLMDEYARYPTPAVGADLGKAFLDVVRGRFNATQRGIGEVSTTYWAQNLRLLNRLIHEGRNSIWAYMLKNTARPLLLAAHKFAVIAGNPPWLSYRYIRDKTYQAEVKKLTLRYGLLERDDVKLFTQMDLSTLFMVHCEAMYLQAGGTIAFVMPRSVITGAKQHRRFQARGVTQVLDLLGMFPLFNVPSCVLIRRADELYLDDVPTVSYRGRLPAHQMPLAQAQPYMQAVAATSRLIGDVAFAGSYYYDLFRPGADLYPRNLCFIRPRQQLQTGDAAVNPAMETDPDLDLEAKAPWKGIRLDGLVYKPNLYATLLSKNLVPFGYQRLHLVALPVRTESNGALKVMGMNEFLSIGLLRSWNTWFEPAEKKWDQLKKSTSHLEDLIDQYNYQQKLTTQRPSGVYKVLYTTSGVHLAACVVDTHGAPPKVYEYPTQGFIVDHKAYYFDTEVMDEAHYLCALLNAPCVDTAIKAYQSRGKGFVGERDIHRTPFEACAIPQFDATDPDHQELARLSQEAHAVVMSNIGMDKVVTARRKARAAVEAQITQIDHIARRLLGLPDSALPAAQEET